MMSPFLMNGILSDEVENLGHIEAVAKQASIGTLTLGHMDTTRPLLSIQSYGLHRLYST